MRGLGVNDDCHSLDTAFNNLFLLLFLTVYICINQKYIKYDISPTNWRIFDNIGFYFRVPESLSIIQPRDGKTKVRKYRQRSTRGRIYKKNLCETKQKTFLLLNFYFVYQRNINIFVSSFFKSDPSYLRSRRNGGKRYFLP